MQEPRVPGTAAGAGSITGQLAGCPADFNGFLVYVPGHASSAFTGSSVPFKSISVPAGTYNLAVEAGGQILGTVTGVPVGTSNYVLPANLPVSCPTLQCPAGQTDCGGTCRDLETDTQSCGACGNACPAGEVCSGGTCAVTCQAGLTECNGSCVNLGIDPTHCGSCNSVCAAGQTCSAGACACQPGQSLCFGACTSTRVDPNNCGACGVSCPAGSVCSNGSCAVTWG